MLSSLLTALQETWRHSYITLLFWCQSHLWRPKLDLYWLICRVLSNGETGLRRSRDRPPDSLSTHPSSAKHIKLKPGSYVSSTAVDHNVNNIAVPGSNSSVSQPQTESLSSTGHCRTDDVVRDISAVKTSVKTSDHRMRVLWSGQVAVNGTDIGSAELLSCCHVRHTL